jgi:hypothetical protein
MKLLAQNVRVDYQICTYKFFFCAFVYVYVKFIEYVFINKLLSELRTQKLQAKILLRNLIKLFRGLAVGVKFLFKALKLLIHLSPNSE